MKKWMIACVVWLVADVTWSQPPSVPKFDEEVTATEFSDRVRSIAAGENSEDRLSRVVALLDKIDVDYDLEPFESGKRTGRNIVVSLGDDLESTIAIGAHFDRVPVGQGVVDNGCGCAALVELIERFREAPLKNHGLKFVFFDQEELGLLGSKEYVKARTNEQLPSFFINIDIFGYGDSIWLMSSDENSALTASFRSAAKMQQFPIRISGPQQYPPSDHLPFFKANVPTVAVALIDDAEIEKVQRLLKRERIEPPPIFRIIHTVDDTFAKVETAECVRALPLLEAAIRELDEVGV